MWMTRFVFFLLSFWCYGTAGDPEAQLIPGIFPVHKEITAPRLTTADLNGDGIGEIIAGGRVGPFRPVTDPYESKQARVDVFKVTFGERVRIGSTGNLHVVDDVTAGDLNGDGVPEIIAVGWRVLHVFRWQRNGLVEVGRCYPGSGRLRRVDTGDADGDGHEELFVVEEFAGSSEVIPMRLFVLDWTPDGCGEELFYVEFSAGIGDIAVHDFDGDACLEFAVEEGAEELGGNVALYRISAGIPVFLSRSQVLESTGRIVSLMAPGRQPALAKGSQHLIGFGTPDGRFGLLRFGGGRLAVVDRWEYPVRDGLFSDYLLFGLPDRRMMLYRGITTDDLQETQSLDVEVLPFVP